MRYFLLLFVLSLAAAEESPSVTEHTVQINGAAIPYTATAGTLELKEKKEPIASLFYVSYTRSDVPKKAERPVTFCFNGGPGSAALWLHIGMVGPRKLVTETHISPPYSLVDNPHSLLDITDLVFIDPVSTGFSRALGEQDPKKFHGVDEDIESFGEFIRLWLTKNGRWTSPKFLMGESYGTTRAAGLAEHLFTKQHIPLNGLILISLALNFQTFLDFQQGNDLPYVLYLPSYTAAAWAHKKLPAPLQNDLSAALKQAEQFASTEYLLALMQGDALPQAQREVIAKKIGQFTGLSPDIILQENLRLSSTRFRSELLKPEGKVIGRFDSRNTSFLPDSRRPFATFDPSTDAVLGLFAGTFNHYLRNELKWESDEEYEVIADVFPWNFSRRSNGGVSEYLNVGQDLREVLSRNPSCHLFTAAGYFDLAIPYFATTYTLNHLGLNPKLQNHIQQAFFDGGHMMYLDPENLTSIKSQLTDFLKKSIP